VERLYASWRHAYVTRSSEDDPCVFCMAQESAEAGALIVHEGRTAYVILNLFPYNSGHLMVVPRRHVARLADLTQDELVEMAELTRAAEQALTEVYRPQGINVGMNLGRPAGAGVADHLHTHLVPRWTGDTNFMSVVGKVRVLPEELPVTAARLRPVFERFSQS
jgi:ATP adenylyltransferase